MTATQFSRKIHAGKRKTAKFADLRPNMLVSFDRALHRESRLAKIRDIFHLHNKYVALGIHAMGHEVAGIMVDVNSDKSTIRLNIPLIQTTLDNVSVAKDARVQIGGKERPLSELVAGMHVVLQMSAETDPGHVIAITETTRK